MNAVTRVLHAIETGDPHAAGELLPLVYDELRRLAAHQLAHELPGQTLDATGLVHEAYLRLVASVEPSGRRELQDTSGLRPDARPEFANRGHFFAAAAEAMRRILVDNARRKQRPKHGGDRRRVDWDVAQPVAPSPPDDLLALNDALDRLERDEPKKATLVKLRFFAGLTMPEAAAAMGVSLATAERYWTYARTWLFAELKDRDS